MKTSFEQPPVSREVWPWTQEGQTAESDGRPSLVGALLPFLVACVVATLFHFYGKHAFMPWVVIGIATVITINALFIPAGHRAIQAFFQKLAVVVNYILTRVLLIPVYILIFAVGHFFLAIRGKDPLDRKLSPEAPTYWLEREKVSDKESYRKQY